MLASASKPSASKPIATRHTSEARLVGWVQRIAPHIILLPAAILVILPFYWMIISSLKPDADLYLMPPTWWPSTLQWSNFTRVLAFARFDIYFFNSLFVAIAQTFINLLFASMAGYAFARLRFRGQKPLFWLLLAKMMVPFYIVLVPVFLVVRFFPLAGGNDLLGQGGSGFVDTFVGLILPGMITPFGIFMFRQFFSTLPKELEDAARIDGCSEFGIYWRIMLPLCKPAIATLAIFSFHGSWNMFVWPLVVTRSDSLRTIQIALSFLRDVTEISWGLQMAATVMATLPMVILFLVLQRYFAEGIAMTGIKG